MTTPVDDIPDARILIAVHRRLHTLDELLVATVIELHIERFRQLLAQQLPAVWDDAQLAETSLQVARVIEREGKVCL